MQKWIQCGREFGEKEVNQIRETIAWLPGLARPELTRTICEHLDWHSASGEPKVQACDALLAKLAEKGLIDDLPIAKQRFKPGTRCSKSITLSERTRAKTAVSCRLNELDPVQLEVTTKRDVNLWNEYVERFHPLGYRLPFGTRMRYFIRSGSLILGCILLAGAAKAIAARDRWIGWETQRRQHNLPWIVNNTRFLIFPHVHVPHLASHVLGQLARRVATDWQQSWGFSPLLLETFVDPAQYAGTCYRAAGWELLGKTSGRGLARPDKNYQSSPKLIFVKPLHHDFRKQLATSALQGRLSDE